MAARASKGPAKKAAKKGLGKKTGGTSTTKGRRDGRRPGAKRAAPKKSPSKHGTRKQQTKKRTKTPGTTTVKKTGPGGKPLTKRGGPGKKVPAKKPVAKPKKAPAKKTVAKPKKAPAKKTVAKPKKAPAKKAATKRAGPKTATPAAPATTSPQEPPRSTKRAIRWTDEPPEVNGGNQPKGKRAPDFSLSDQDGRTWTRTQLEGKPFVLYFYPKDDTPGCTKEACAFRDNYEEFRKRGVTVLGVSADSVESHRKFADKYNLPFPLLADTDRKLIEALDAWQEKSMYGRKYMGIQRKTVIVGPDGSIVKEYPKVSPEEHAREILGDLERMPGS